jgi:hypothetical protein
MPQSSFAPGANDFTYTPTWASSGTQPALGNGTLTGKYALVGDLLFLQIRLLMGSTTTFGTGLYTFSIPSGLSLITPATGVASAFDASPATIHAGVVRYDSATTIAIAETDSNNFWGQTSPMTWANADDLGLFLTAFVTVN